jgi:hypothetical protein
MNASGTRMKVADIRRSLCAVRKMWQEHSPEKPINLVAELSCGLSVTDFCFSFVLAHHTKRVLPPVR